MTAGRPPIQDSRPTGGRGPQRLVGRSLRRFLGTEAAGGIVLLGATLIALVWANSAFADGYVSLWRTEIRIGVPGYTLAQDLRHWVNDLLMTIFFFLVGLEIKRELVVGELSEPRRAALPVLAALGGMVVPALLYLAFNAGGAGAAGWGIPMATDIAFAVGVLALLGGRIPSGLKVFLLVLAIVDDIGAIVVIALFYPGGVKLVWLITAASLALAIALLRRMKVHWTPIYVALGVGVWLATFESGIHPTIAGVALGLLMPVAERLEQRLHPWTSYLIVPVFALANAGVVLSAPALRDAATSNVTVGIVAGLVVGKALGISAMAWLAIKLGLARPPTGVTWRHLIGGAAVAGIGFTVSLFVTALAFTDPALIYEAKVGVLLASVVSGLLGAVILGLRARIPTPPS